MSTYAACDLTTNAVVAIINDPTDAPVAMPGTYLIQVPPDFDGVGKRHTGAESFIHDPSLLEVPTEFKEQQVRAQRTALLTASDWTQMPDTGMTTTRLAEWREYRQALRDVTKQPGFPNVIWPTPPG